VNWPTSLGAPVYAKAMTANRRRLVATGLTVALGAFAGACGSSSGAPPSGGQHSITRTTPDTAPPTFGLASVCQATNAYGVDQTQVLAVALAAAAAQSGNTSIRQAGDVMASHASTTEAWKTAYVKVRGACVAAGLTGTSAPG
jgi:hypothetical protein